MPLPLAMAVVILATSVTSGGIGVNKILGAHRTNTRAEEIRRQAETVIRNAQQQAYVFCKKAKAIKISTLIYKE